MSRRIEVVLAGVVAAMLAAGLSLAVGARPIAPGDVLQALLHPATQGVDTLVVLTQRLPRTVIGAAAGAALAAAGAVMQGLTRNPLADPGLLGVNAGASAAVLTAIAVLGISSPAGFIGFALAGAAMAALVVWLIGSAGADGASPAKLALTGAAITAGLTSVSMLILTTDRSALNVYRFWSVGSLTGRGMDAALLLLPVILIGLVLALICAPGLNLLALGEDTARGLGHGVGRTRTVAIVAIIVLCGAATALAGPLVFVGLIVPHAVRAMIGADHRWIVGASIPFGAALLLVADTVGRVIAMPGEVEAGLVVAFVGAPVLLWLVVRRRAVAL